MITKLLAILLLFSFAGSMAAQLPQSKPAREVPPDFKSDGCSGWPDGDYRECCEAHDLDYYFGGTAKERKESDKRLYKCVRDKGHKVNAILMLIGVRFAASKWIPTPFRWGFGKKSRKRAKELARQQAEAAAAAPAAPNNTN
jgi:hypothetical protein